MKWIADGDAPPACGGASFEPLPVQRFTTSHLPPAERYAAWCARNWPRNGDIYRTEPFEPFDTYWESVQLGPILFVYTEISGMRWERGEEDIRRAPFDYLVVSMMVDGLAEGDLDGQHLHEPAGTLHFHDLSRPSLHVSSASRTYSAVLPRPVAEQWLAPAAELHGLVASGPAATLLFAHAAALRQALPRLPLQAGPALARSFLELITLAAAEVRPHVAVTPDPEAQLRARALHEIERRLGDGGSTVEQLARILNVPRARLFAAFQPEGGVHNYTMQVRLDRARAALADQERVEPIGDIAHRLGFSDASHFSRLFRRRFGMTPRDYRRLVADGSEKPS